MTTNEPILLRSDRDGITTLTLNRPQQRNALTRALIAELHDALNKIAADKTIRVVVIAASGPAFCSGHDLRELRANTEPTFYDAVFSACSAMMLAIVKLPQPVIARVHATATAAGCQLVASADLAIAAETARFATPGVDIGLFCSTPMVAVSRNLSRKRVMEMLLTGEMIDAETATQLGLINRAVPADQLDAEIARVANLIAAKSALTLRIGKEAFYRQLELPQADAYSYVNAVMTRNMATRDAAEGIDAFLAKRQPTWYDA
ncbi:MAG: enoyl-CoA hydratase [Proteobacteria bacterium]|nr:enoyl-CoA hydratase [Pseudomonadota bacterium]